MKIVLAFILSLLPLFAQAEARVFFEPTQEDYDCCAVEVQTQYKAYLEAKGAGNYGEAVKLALFNWTRAWLHFNKAMSTVASKANWNAPEVVEEALSYIDLAERDATEAGVAGKECLALVNKNKKTLMDKLASLRKAKNKTAH